MLKVNHKRKEVEQTVEHDYSSLIGFVYSTPELRSKAGFARYLGISFSALANKLNNTFAFKQAEIMKMKVDFNLSPEQIDRYFFTPKLRKVNDGTKED